jgi:sulfonate transport system permease protein
LSSQRRTRSVPLPDPLGLGVSLLVIAGWEALVRTGVLHFGYLPAPSAILGGFGDLLLSGALARDVAHTVGVALLSAAIAILLGVVVGAAIGLVPAIQTFTGSSIDVLRSLPVIALIPVAILVLGPEFRTEVIIAVYAATWPVLINTAGGVRSVHPQLYDVARTFQLSRRERLRKIILPATMPAILVGSRLAVVSALVVAIVAEMLANPQGVGWGLMQTLQGLRVERMWAYSVTCGVLGFVVNAALVYAVRRALPGGITNRALAD